MSDASAPGKLVLIGEYAVLDGHFAVVAAMDVRAEVRFTPADTLILEGNTSGPVDRESARAQLPLLAAVLDAVEARDTHGITARSGEARAGHYHVDTSAFQRAGKKVGLGSSGAACVAFTRALLPHVDADEVFAVARDAHRSFQGGGSGIDIAASTYGGIVRYSIVKPPKRGLTLPDALAVVVVFTGHSTSTQGFVDRYLALPDRDAHAEAIGSCARSFLVACEEHDVAGVLQSIGEAREAMLAMGSAAHMEVVGPLHLKIAALARAHGGEAKPSGAGGGDVAVALVPLDAKARFSAAVEAAGFSVVPVAVDPHGVS